ncbi:dynamin family protein [Flavobacterium caseinilyticum]|uniref:Dynamin N-terminal domain-containing protein n=1 Tax=Flavobacterium caseinilyticum TaxID=2541732 RepID=A0A4R5AU22_9FLAO|nr:dynamin family protein [Flavobacterium caseinilyticum]TDD74624.1 hypothetical protein E0F89_14045 [Flavobacterium caseinilyticum]
MKDIKSISEDFKKVLNLALEKTITSVPEKNAEDIKIKTQSLINDLNDQLYIKVPFIGDFSAGKSSLLNAYLNRPELLPTSIRPETAVSYELYYAPVETVEHYRKGLLITDKGIGDLAHLNVQAGDIVKVYVDNQKVKELIERNIVLVDMPGTDSSLEAHEKAIMSYLTEGTAFITLVDCEHGSLKQSALRFISEVQGYDIDAHVLVTKSDKKPLEDRLKIKDYIESQMRRYVKGAISVGIVSSVKNEIEDLEKVIANLDSFSLYKQRFSNNVMGLLDEMISILKMRNKTLSENVESLKKELLEIHSEQEKAILKLNENNETKKVSSASTDLILDEIKNKLVSMETDFVNEMINNPNNGTGVNQRLIESVRPIMISELGKVQETLWQDLQDKTATIFESISQFENTERFDSQSVIGTIETKIKPLTDLVFKNSKVYKGIIGALGIGTAFVAPWVEILIFFGPDILKFFGIGGDSRKEKEAMYKDNFLNKVVPGIVNHLRPKIEESLAQSHHEMVLTLQNEINEKVMQIQNSIEARSNEVKQSEEQINIEKEAIEVKIVLIEELKIQAA